MNKQIGKIVARQPKVSDGGMPSRNKETYSPLAPCHKEIPRGTNVKATVDKVLNRIK